jgi:hypothetical protein
MGFKIGLITGATAGYVLGTRASVSQRARVDRMLRAVSSDPRVRSTADSVKRNVGQVADSVTERFTGAVDHAGDAIDAVVADTPDERPTTRSVA